jgi:hypothetical protein
VLLECDQNRHDVNVNSEIKLESVDWQGAQIKEEHSGASSDLSLCDSRQSPDPKIKYEDGDVKPKPE